MDKFSQAQVVLVLEVRSFLQTLLSFYVPHETWNTLMGVYQRFGGLKQVVERLGLV